MLETVGEWIEASGAMLYVLAPAFTAIVAVLPLPAEVPAMINGMAFGPFWGSVVTWTGAMIGAQFSFEVARRWGRPAAGRVVPARWLERADRTVSRAGWPTLLALRLMPTVAFTAINWAAGLTSVSRRTFVWTTAVGILPGAIAFTTGGAGLLELARGSGRGVVLLSIAALLLLTAAGIVVLWRGRVPGRRP